jgi:ribosomal protein L34E
MSRKRSFSDLLKKNETERTSQPTQKKVKVICNCATCNGKLVAIRTELAHRYRAQGIQQPLKRQRSDLGLEMLNLSD